MKKNIRNRKPADDMKEERTVTLNGQLYTVVISDEYEALLSAAADGRAVIGLWDRNASGQELLPAAYAVERPEDVDEELLTRVVKRSQGLPWVIGETERLIIREFCAEDIPGVFREQEDWEADKVFYIPEKLNEYIRCQYGFYEYGMWALVDKKNGLIIGKAGITNLDVESVVNHEIENHEDKLALELGYHIFSPYRRQGYAKEACREILSYVEEHLNAAVYAKIDPSNEASIQLALECGFHFIEQRYSESVLYYSLYGWNC